MTKLDRKLIEYAERFDDGFPMYQVGRGRTEDEIVSIIVKCLEENKDAYELGYCEDDDDIQY